MSGRTPFRAWFYFRQGWSVYFAFVMAAINTLTVTYFLAIERIPSLQIIFPSFAHYVIIITLIGIPLLIIIGYVHYKRSPSFKAEASVAWESNPYARRNLVNSELNVRLNLKLMQMILKLSNNEKISQKELEEISEYHKELADFVTKRNLENKKDVNFFKDMQK